MSDRLWPAAILGEVQDDVRDLFFPAAIEPAPDPESPGFADKERPEVRRVENGRKLEEACVYPSSGAENGGRRDPGVADGKSIRAASTPPRSAVSRNPNSPFFGEISHSIIASPAFRRRRRPSPSPFAS